MCIFCIFRFGLFLAFLLSGVGFSIAFSAVGVVNWGIWVDGLCLVSASREWFLFFFDSIAGFGKE